MRREGEEAELVGEEEADGAGADDEDVGCEGVHFCRVVCRFLWVRWGRWNCAKTERQWCYAGDWEKWFDCRHGNCMSVWVECRNIRDRT